MGLFGDFRRYQKTKNILLGILHAIPEVYKVNRQFKNCSDFIEHREFELAIGSLIEMTAETGGTFSKEFWLALADCAESMQLKESAIFCREQISF